MNLHILKRSILFLGSLASCVFLANCGSSSSGSSPNGNTPNNGASWSGGPLQSLSSIQGTWVQNRCVAISGGSVKTYYKVTPTETDQVSLDSGNLFYSGNSVCSGASSNLGETYIGATEFSGTDVYGVKKYFFGILHMVSGIDQDYVFALKDSTTICIFHRTSDLASAQDVDAFVNAIDNADCYSK